MNNYCKSPSRIIPKIILCCVTDCLSYGINVIHICATGTELLTTMDTTEVNNTQVNFNLLSGMKIQGVSLNVLRD